ncbi:MAG: MGH1-like glycoside hydrolase domain-containing protein [Chloroflexota bacterium]
MEDQLTTNVAKGIGPSERVAIYQVPDNEMAAGSTLGGPKITVTIKATGAIATVYSPIVGETLVGTVVLRHYDERLDMHLSQTQPGVFIIHPEHQEHVFTLDGGIAVRDDIFVLSGRPQDGKAIDPPAAYYSVELHNTTDETVSIASYAFIQLRGETTHDVVTAYDDELQALLAWNAAQPDNVRIIGCSVAPRTYEVTLDAGKAVAERSPGLLSGATGASTNPLGVLHVVHSIRPHQRARFSFQISFSNEGKRGAREAYRACPPAETALQATQEYYGEILSRSRVLTPNPEVNRGVLWAKANMLRVMTDSPTGWSFVNDPGRSNNSVGRDTAWFAYGADYLVPEFSKESLRSYVRLQEKNGKIVEYYDIRTSKSEDYGLNINDNTPLLILALWHHYTTTGDAEFLKEIYPAAARAARYIVSQENDQGLVWCTATGTSDWGIIGWRNVIKNYRLSGATTEVNAECYAALQTMTHMARVLGKHRESGDFQAEADQLKAAINQHLRNPANGLYYLNIDLDGHPCSDVTSDLVFPVMFGVADDETAANIVARLSQEDFWTAAGIRTTPRDAPTYSPGPEPAYGLMGGVWVGVAFWFARAAAPYMPAFTDRALAMSFHNYSRDPRRSNTVPGQFSEWLHGETLVNQGMMLSPWFPPRYLWAAIEGVAGLTLEGDTVRCWPRLSPTWKWLGVQNLPYRGRQLTWFAARTPDVQMYSNFHFQESSPYVAYEEDISSQVHVRGDGACALGLRQSADIMLFVGNTEDRAITTALRVDAKLAGSYRKRSFNSLIGRWQDDAVLVPAAQLQTGIVLELERQGFALLDLQQEL